MPLQSNPSFKPTEYKRFILDSAGIGGLDLHDLEFEQDASKSPYMLNMMYKNGSFCKRYGQEVYDEQTDTIYSMIEYRGNLVKHIGTNIYSGETLLGSNLPTKKGMFAKFNQNLYYFCDDIYVCYYDSNEYKLLTDKPSDWDTNWTNYYKYKNGAYVKLTDTTAPTFDVSKYYKLNGNYNKLVWEKVEPYIPKVVLNRKPDGSGGNTSEAYNMIGKGFKNDFHGDDKSTEFHLTDKELDEKIPKVIVDNVEWTYDENLSADKTFKVDYETGVVTLKSAAPSGTNNVEIIAYKHDDEWTSYHDQIVGSKYYACFGGNNNSRLFVAGGGKSTYYYSDVYDASYFPYTNYARVGNSADDITGFGNQYNVLLIFKPTEIYSLTYYVTTSDTTTSESQIGTGAFSSQVVNNTIGCDCPNTIQLINNQLTWFSSISGICTLVSTNIVDERNVRIISRNIERANTFGVKGIFDIDLFDNNTSIKDSVQSMDYDSKYFLIFPKMYDGSVETDCGSCYVWDYAISPYTITSTKATNPADLVWFLFDRFYVNNPIKYNDDFIYISTFNTKQIIKLNDTRADLDFNGDGISDPINSYYMSPYLSFDAPDYLKSIKNMYVQCNIENPTMINITYLSNEEPNGTEDKEPIYVYSSLWKNFSWSTFGYQKINIAKTFRRKCAIKKVELMAVKFENNILDSDMAISFLGFDYILVKRIK